MGWAQGYYDYPETTKESTIMMEIEDSLETERGYMEPVQLPFLFMKNVEVFPSRGAAMDYLRSDACRQYDRRKNVGVRYRSLEGTKPTKRKLDLERRVKETQQKIQDYSTAHSVLNFKAEYVGCPGCGSKLKRDLLHSDTCPLCRKDMRSETTIKTINGYYSKIEELRKEIEEENRKIAAKGKVYWLIDASIYLG